MEKTGDAFPNIESHTQALIRPGRAVFAFINDSFIYGWRICNAFICAAIRQFIRFIVSCNADQLITAADSKILQQSLTGCNRILQRTDIPIRNRSAYFCNIDKALPHIVLRSPTQADLDLCSLIALVIVYITFNLERALQGAVILHDFCRHFLICGQLLRKAFSFAFEICNVCCSFFGTACSIFRSELFYRSCYIRNPRLIILPRRQYPAARILR